MVQNSLMNFIDLTLPFHSSTLFPSFLLTGCDRCNEWFHGDCIGIREDEARSIKRWYCQVCRSNDSKLCVEYKPKKIPSPPPEPKEVKTKKSKR